MVGLSDIPCVGKTVDRVSDATVDAVFRGLRYLFCYKSIVNNLNSEIEKVKVQEDRVSRKIDAEKSDGKRIENHVTKWQKEVEESKIRADELLQQRPSCMCFKVVMFPNPVTRFQLGRKAAQEAKNAVELTLSGENLLHNEIAYLPADVNIPMPDTTYQKFQSREEAYGKLWHALVKEDGYPIIGIYGMPGVGKTTMMEQAWEDAKDKKIFEKVTRANVGDGNVDVINIQNQLAGFLGCHLKSEVNYVHRASQLKNSLMNGGKTLVVLDDVWGPIPLKTIGIPHGDDIPRGCKILLTSRREDVCLHNHCKDPIKIQILTDGEAWDMFRNTVGTSKIDSLQDTSLAQNVCKECAGLPLLIHAVGNALKFATADSWKDALFQLENCNFEEIDGIESKVYTCVQLSFDKLNKAEKTCLLLCSLFPEDAEIETNMLVDFATGSQLINRGRNIKGVVDNLKSSSLLLEGKFRHTVKMHDIIRDVSRSLAARDHQYAFLFIRGGSCLPVLDDYSTRKLLQCVDVHKFGYPTDMVCPNLHTLWLECNNQPQQLSNAFFEVIGNLKILVLKGMQVFVEQMSLQTFDKLTMLILDGCDLNKISLSIIPKNVEILKISKCYLPNLLDLPKLKSLRKLEILSGSEIEMVSNAISALSPTLEELNIPGGLRIYDVVGKRSVPISSELNKLAVLTNLAIRLEDTESCPTADVVANLLDFVIHVGDDYDRGRLGTLEIETKSVIVTNRCIEGGLEVLVERAENVILMCVKGLLNGFRNSNREAFSTLKKLYMGSCEDIEHLAWAPYYEIHQSQPLTSFSKLTSLEIQSCSRLKYLFCACVAKCLVQLQELRILTCAMLEVVIKKESATDGVIIKLPKLKLLVLCELQSFRRFYGETGSTCSSSTTIMETDAASPAGSVSLFHDGTVSFLALETLRIQSLKISDIWEKNCCMNNYFSLLKSLLIYDCPNLEFAIPLAMLSTSQNLEELTIGDCASMTSEVESSSNESSNVEPALVALLSLSLSDMPALTKTGLNSRSRNLYPSLEKLYINNCHGLRNVFLPSVAKDLVHLENVFINGCEMMSEIIGEEEINDDFVFPALTSLYLTALPNIKSFCFSKSIEAQATAGQSYLIPKVSFPKLEVLSLDVKTITLEEIELGRNNSTSEIKNLAVRVDKELQLPYKWQLQLPNIEELSLKNCWWPVNTGEHNVGQSIINPGRTLNFQRLKVVKVDRCGVSALFSCTVFRNLHQLQELKVTRCPLIEEVVRDENNIIGTEENTITLFRLKSIELKHLPILKSFSGSKSYIFNMPALTSINVRNCPQMENFTCLNISTPLIPDFSSQVQKYLNDPDGESDEDSPPACVIL